MSLLDDFQRYQTGPVGFTEPTEVPEAAVLDSGFVSVAPYEEQAPIFALDKVQFKLTNALLHMVVSNNIIAMALENNHILRIDLANPQEVEDVELSKRSEDRIHAIFFDPSGRHLIISFEGGETLYLFAKSKKPKPLTKLKGIVIDSIAWNKPGRNDTSTKEILIGSNKGQIFETELEPTEDFFRKEEKFFKQIYKFPDPMPITGLRMEQFPVSNVSNNRKYLVLATTPTRIYQFVGLASSGKEGIFEGIFASYATNAGFQELPGNLSYSEIQFFSQYQGVAKAFAWLTGPGIYHGSLVFGSQNAGDSVIDNASLLQYPTSKASNSSQAPVSLAITEFHFLLLYRDRLVAIGRLDEQVVLDEQLPKRLGDVRRIVTDVVKNTMWVYTATSIFEVVITDEDRNVWQIHLNNKQFDLALQYTKNPAQKDKVCTAQADHYFSLGRYQLAANFYAQSQKSFEEVTLRFIRKAERDALKTFLVTKLNYLRPTQDATQITIICTWLVEIFLDKLNELRDKANDEVFKAIQDEFYAFLSQNMVKDHLNHATTYNLIASHGRTDELLFFALLVEDYERVITHYIQQGNYLQALRTMQRQTSARKAETYYKFSPVLMEHVASELVNTWMRERDLDPKMLIPALMKYDQKRQRDLENQAIRYLQHCVQKQNNEDPAIHNFLLTLYAQQVDDAALQKFLSSDTKHFDLQYALRLCTQHKKTQACILIYSAMGLYEEAVELALQHMDLELAKINADKPEEDEALRKKLWLRIAKHVVQTENDIKQAMAFLKDCELLKIEDVLPFFSDFVLIDDFKDEICAALEEYNRHIDDLKQEMDEATRSAEAIRQDIRELRNKYCYVGANEKCRLCHFPLLTRQFYLFPCQHMFHADCLTAEMMNYLNVSQRQRVLDLQQKINNEVNQGPATRKDGEDMAVVIPKSDQLKASLDDIIAAECPHCGDIMIKSIEKPFLSERELETIRSWDLK